MQFIVIPAAPVKDPTCPPGVLATLAALASFADRQGLCWPSVPTIATVAGQSPATVRRSLAWLQGKGYLEIRARRASGGSQTSNLYRLLYDLPAEAVEVPDSPTPPLTGDRGAPISDDRGPLAPEIDELQPENNYYSSSTGDLLSDMLKPMRPLQRQAIHSTIALHISGDRQPRATMDQCTEALRDLLGNGQTWSGIRFANYLRLKLEVDQAGAGKPMDRRAEDDLRALGGGEATGA